METGIKPIFSCNSLIDGDAIVFFDSTKTVEFTTNHEIHKKLCYLCNGFNDIIFIIDQFSDSEKEEVSEYVKMLLDYELLIDSRSALVHYQKISNNPQPFESELFGIEEIASYSIKVRKRHLSNYSEEQKHFPMNMDQGLVRLLEGRSSIRSFSGLVISAQSLINMIWATYGSFSLGDESWKKVTPSAGGLYPLDLYLIL